ncbi:hypothetical protein E2C01_015082 [Portunus trituberculatus]|uniref:Uncharacterized protein n=1 Tax=Portunus trituberculatus TaxID=210409 RepID=A0A5B7DM76_PORTR|nr:hypothetical protein [Portunus trituberculatus]
MRVFPAQGERRGRPCSQYARCAPSHSQVPCRSVEIRAYLESQASSDSPAKLPTGLFRRTANCIMADVGSKRRAAAEGCRVKEGRSDGCWRTRDGLGAPD